MDHSYAGFHKIYTYWSILWLKLILKFLSFFLTQKIPSCWHFSLNVNQLLFSFHFLVQKNALVVGPTKSSLGTMHPCFLWTFGDRIIFESNSLPYLWESRNECKSKSWLWIMLQKDWESHIFPRILYFLVGKSF